MDLARIRALLTLHEGCVPHAYQDSLGYWTIGIGHLIDKRKGGRLPDEIIVSLFEYDLRQVCKTLPEWAWRLDEVRLAVLIDMSFNLGPEPFNENGFKDWPKFVAQVKDGRYAEAAANMRSTLWAKQVKVRADRLATMMESGKWPADLPNG